jgi:hypothetical protein
MNRDFWWQFFEDELLRFCAHEMGVYEVNRCIMSGCDGIVHVERVNFMVSWRCSKCGKSFSAMRMREWQNWQTQIREQQIRGEFGGARRV